MLHIHKVLRELLGLEKGQHTLCHVNEHHLVVQPHVDHASEPLSFVGLHLAELSVVGFLVQPERAERDFVLAHFLYFPELVFDLSHSLFER